MRLSVQKTLKMYVGGAFIRSESGRIYGHTNAEGAHMNIPQASRKDLRNTIEKARGALAGWSARTAYNRGQILYRIGEMLESQADNFPTSAGDLSTAIDRAVHHAGWTDKITAILSSLNPVGMAYVNYSMVRPLGVVFAVPDPKDGLTGMLEAICAPLVMSDTVVLMVDNASAELAVALSEAIAVSDVPPGVINVLTGQVDEVLRVANRHDDIDGLFLCRGALTDDLLLDCEVEAARVMRRISVIGGAASPSTPMQLARLGEIQTVWMSSGGNMPSGGAAY
jgi:acyl-CoA reductase-like NAD-dependent aldehyde dehydrogenase